MMEFGVVEEVRLRKKRKRDHVLATGVDVKMEEFSDTEVSSRQASMRVGRQRSPLLRRRALRRSPVAGYKVFDAIEDARRQRRVAFLEKDMQDTLRRGSSPGWSPSASADGKSIACAVADRVADPVESLPSNARLVVRASARRKLPKIRTLPSAPNAGVRRHAALQFRDGREEHTAKFASDLQTYSFTQGGAESVELPNVCTEIVMEKR